MRAVLAGAVLLGCASVAVAQTSAPASEAPSILREIGFDQRVNVQVPLDLPFRDELGAVVSLGSYFGHGRPVVLVLVYYSCPMLCLQTLGNLSGTVRDLPFRAGEGFDVLAVSFDPHDTPAFAAAKKAALFETSPSLATGWHFLTGDQASIRRLTAAVGFHYVFDDSLNQFAHPAGLIVLTPNARIARYLFGIDYKPLDLRLAIVDASHGRIGSATDAVLLYCYHYEPTKGRYGLLVMRLVRTAGASTVVCMAGLLLFFLRRERRGMR
jgi:protein SCO1/2